MSTVRGPCPQCDRGPRDTALAITTDEVGTVAYCHRCGHTEFSAAERRTIHDVPVRTTPKDEKLEWSTRAELIWQRTQSLRGTIGETYLHFRGCVLPPRDSHLRFLPSSANHPPALCACITDVRTSKPISLHFTQLAGDGCGKAGTGRDKLLLKDHRKKGGCIRLWPEDAVTHGLAVAEGIESALAAAHAYTPVWAAIDCNNLASLPVLAGIESLVIFADHDDAGIRAARECAQRWSDAAREVRIAMPEHEGTDFADLVAA